VPLGSLYYYGLEIIVNKKGETIASYRKQPFYYIDDNSALELLDRFYDGVAEGLGNAAMGICKR
jgi:hypothetical protein